MFQPHSKEAAEKGFAEDKEAFVLSQEQHS